MGRIMFMRKGEVHTTPKKPGISLGDLAEGNIVYFAEGSPAKMRAFYVAKHNYESTLNGTDRTLLVRKECIGQGAFNTTNVATYNNSTMDVYFNGTYLNLLKANYPSIGLVLSTTRIPMNQYGTSFLDKAVFAISATELGITNTEYAIPCGSKLPISDVLKQAVTYSDSTWLTQCLYYVRNQSDNSALPNQCFAVQSGITSGKDDKTWYQNASYDGGAGTSGIRCYRPCFTVPTTTIFDESTLYFKGAV